MTRNKATFFKIIQLIAAHVIMLVVLIIGYDQANIIVQNLISYLTSASNEIFIDAKILFFQGMSLEKHLLLGALFIAGLLAFDIVSISKWLKSFSFAKSKCCKNCERKLIREPRQPIDRFLSYIVSLKRYRCIACNDEYLIVDNRSKRQFSTKRETLKTSPVKKSD